MIALAIAVIPLVLWPTVDDLSPAAEGRIRIADWTIWCIFFVEIVVTTYRAPNRLKHLGERWYELPVLLMPVFDTLGVFRSLRVVRSARVLRGLRATRGGAYLLRALGPLRLLLERHGLHYVLGAAAILYLIAAAFLTFFEEGSSRGLDRYREWLAWGLVEIVGLDLNLDRPETVGGKSVAVFVALLGIVLLAVVTANLSAFFLRSQEIDSQKLDQVLGELRALQGPRTTPTEQSSLPNPDP